MNPELAEILKAHLVEVFQINEDQITHTVTFRSKPVAPATLRADLMRHFGGHWKIEFSELPDNWNQPAPEAQKGPMTKDEYMQFHEDACKKMIAITKAKNSDYTGASADPFANFAQIGSLVQAPSVVEIGFLTRMSDKISRIGSFVSKGTLLVKDESVEDTLLDLANYCILFAGYLKSKRVQQ